MKKTRRNRKVMFINNIVLGVITTLICNLLQHAFNNIPLVGKSLISTIQNFVISSAAHVSPNTIIIMTMEFLLGFFLSFTIVTLFSNVVFNKRKKKYNKLKSNIIDINSRIDKNSANYEPLKNDLEKASQELEAVKNENINSIHRIKFLGIILAIIIFFYVVYITISLVIPIILLDQFNRDIQLIKPYSDSNTIMVIESDWIRMKTLDDYNNLYSVINEIKADNFL